MLLCLFSNAGVVKHLCCLFAVLLNDSIFIETCQSYTFNELIRVIYTRHKKSGTSDLIPDLKVLQIKRQSIGAYDR